LKAAVVGGVSGDELGLLTWNIAGKGLAVFPALEIVVRALGSLADNTELARLHPVDLGHLLEQ